MIRKFPFFQTDITRLRITVVFGLVAAIHVSLAGAAPPPSSHYLLQNLVSDIPNLASITDTNLLNPWGLAFGPSTPFWVADNHAGLSTVYNSTGGVQSVVVTIPPPSGGTPPAAPTGILFNTTTNFAVNGEPAKFIFATEDGTISAWSSGTTAVLEADNSGSDTIYKGIALASNNTANFLYAADFKGGKIDVFDANFQPVKNANSFVDPSIPAGFAPFNVANIGGNLYVTYAKQDEDKEDDVRGDGNGYINVFDPTGNLLKRFASTGTLNSACGLVMAPTNFGGLGGGLLAGNFGDGRINAFDPATGNLLGQLQDSTGAPLHIEGLWDLKFGNGTK